MRRYQPPVNSDLLMEWSARLRDELHQRADKQDRVGRFSSPTFALAEFRRRSLGLHSDRPPDSLENTSRL